MHSFDKVMEVNMIRERTSLLVRIPSKLYRILWEISFHTEQPVSAIIIELLEGANLEQRLREARRENESVH